MAQKGRLLLLKIGDGEVAEEFDTIAGLRDTSVTINETEVDVTSKDDDGIRQLLEGNILQSVAVSGAGVFKDDETIDDLRSKMYAGEHANFQVVIPGSSTAGGTYEGAFRVTSLEYSGTHDGEAQYSVSLESADEIEFEAAS